MTDLSSKIDLGVNKWLEGDLYKLCTEVQAVR